MCNVTPLPPPANSETKEARTLKLCTVVAYYITSTTKKLKFFKLPFFCLQLLFYCVLDLKNELKIEFPSSFILNEIHTVVSPFNEDLQNITFPGRL